MKLNIIEPNYFKDFHCIGIECKNTCCQKWNVFFTRKDYIDVKNARKSKDLQEICNSHFRRIKKNAGLPENFYAQLVFNENGTCPLLSEDGLCKLQLECGYKALPSICKEFPRIHFQYMSSAEQYISTGCEETVRLLMNMPNGIELTSGGDIDHTKFINPVFAVTDFQRLSTAPFKFYWDIKTLTISIMKNRNYSVEDRLILLGIAFKHIDELISTNEGDKIPSYIDGLIAVCTTDKSMLDDLKDIEPKIYLNALNFASILVSISYAKSFTEEFFEKIKSNLGIVYDYSETGNHTNFKSDINKIDKQLGLLFNMLSGREYILENFMLNSMLYLNLPFADTSLSFWDSYIFICMVYSIMIFMLAGNLTEKSDDNDIIEAFVIFSRCLFHNHDLRKLIINSIKINDFSTLGSMVSLIKF